MPMSFITKLLIAIVAMEHVLFLYIEMFAWETIGKKTFRTFPKELFTPTKAMAANQGLYNGFLVAGLVWSLLITDPIWSEYVAVFFLSCVVIAGIFGAVTVSKRIFFIQAVPALVALCTILLAQHL